MAPGIIETDMLRAVPPEVLAPLEAQLPLGRVGQPREVAEASVSLASEQASYITGVVLRVAGGCVQADERQVAAGTPGIREELLGLVGDETDKKLYSSDREGM